MLAKPVMRKTPAGLARFLLAAWLILPPMAHEAFAASWQWASMPRRERVTIALDAPQADIRHSRTGRQEITLPLGGSGLLQRTGPTPASARILDDVKVEGADVRISTRTPGFGYILTRPDPGHVVIDLFEDPLGNSWQPDTTAPAATATAATATAPATTAPVSTPAEAPAAIAARQAAEAIPSQAPPAAQLPRPVTPTEAAPAAPAPVAPPVAPPAPLKSRGIVETPLTDARPATGTVSGQLAPGNPVTPLPAQEPAAPTADAAPAPGPTTAPPPLPAPHT
ncbi:MAG TPA: hypothetical protein DEF41_15560, partial [Desulfovibrio sp.]|nr:hypothetical protein [Desulfovibrio sp.]